MFCERCGRKIDASAKFCENCGAALTFAANGSPCMQIPAKPAKKGIKPIIIVAIIAGAVITTVFVAIIATAVISEFTGKKTPIYSVTDYSSIRNVLMKDWDSANGKPEALKSYLELDFGYDKVTMTRYHYGSELTNYKKEETFKTTYRYEIVSSSRLALYYGSSTTPRYYDFSFNSSKTVMTFQLAEDGLEGHTKYTLYAKN